MSVSSKISKQDSTNSSDALEAKVHDMLWRKFDEMLKEFLRMEQTAPAVEIARNPSGK